MDPYSVLRYQNHVKGNIRLEPQFRVLRYYWSNGNVKYYATNILMDALETDPTWQIVKYSEDGSKEWGVIQGAVAVESSLDVLFLGYT